MYTHVKHIYAYPSSLRLPLHNSLSREPNRFPSLQNLSCYSTENPHTYASKARQCFQSQELGIKSQMLDTSQLI